MVWNTARDEQVRQNIHHVIRAQTIIYAQRKTLPGVFINNRQEPDLRPTSQTVEHKVIGPDVILPARSQPDAGAVIQVKTAALLMFLWNSQGFLPPGHLFMPQPPPEVR